MEESPKAASKTGKVLTLLLKIAVTAACLWYVSGKINFKEAGTAPAKCQLALPADGSHRFCYFKIVFGDPVKHLLQKH